jgi:hypothetical protein
LTEFRMTGTVVRPPGCIPERVNRVVGRDPHDRAHPDEETIIRRIGPFFGLAALFAAVVGTSDE